MPPLPEGRLAQAVASLRTALAEPATRRLVIAWFAIVAGKWTLLVTTLVIAYDRGGTVAVGILGLVRYLTPAVVAPFAGVPTGRWRPLDVLRAANLARTVAAAAVAIVVILGAPLPVLLLGVALEAGAGAFTRPLHMGLLPACASSPSQLVAANVTSSAAEGLGTFVGPVIASLLLLSTGPQGALVAVVIIYAAAVLATVGARVAAVGRHDAGTGTAVLAGVAAGVRALVELPGARLVLLGFAAQTFVRGLLTVITVVAAIELLGMGEPGVGTLNAAMGLGALIGAVTSIALTGRARLGPAFLVALIGWGAPIAVIGLIVGPAIAILAMVVVGLSNAFLDVAGYTLIQRTTPNEARISVLGLTDGVANLGPALGGVIAPVLLQAAGVQGALIVTGALLPVVAIVLGLIARGLDEGGPAAARRVELIRGQHLFVPLSLATVEHLAATLVPRTYESGTWLMREGEPGEEYVLVDRGEVEVSQGGNPLRNLGAGSGVGEIALIEKVPRTASVRAIDEVAAFSLDRDAFLEAVTGQPASQSAARHQASERLAEDRARSS
jgi:MFS family permease